MAEKFVMLIDRYIARAVIFGALASLSVFAALFIFIDFVAELDSVGKHHYGLTQALWYVVLSTPQRLYELSPPAILLGGLISLGAMAANSEMVAMRAAGITIARIIRSVLQAGIPLVVMVVLLGEWVAPKTTPAANALRAVALEKKVLAGSKSGFWAKDGNRFINVREVLPNMRLNGVHIYQLNSDRQLKKSTFASQASFVNGRWHLNNVKHSELSNGSVKTSSSPVEVWDKLIDPELFDVLQTKPINMSAMRLYQYSQYIEKNELDASSYQLAFWIKIFTPLTCLAMLLIAMPIVLTTTPRSGGTGQRIIIGLMLGIGYFVLNRAINHLGIVYGMMPFLSAFLPLLLVVLLSIIMLRRIH